MSNGYKATKEQMLMKELRRNGVQAYKLIEKLRKGAINDRYFTESLAQLAKKCEKAKNHRTQNALDIQKIR